MRCVQVRAGRPYEVIIGRGLMGEAGDKIAQALGRTCAAAILTDDTVDALYGAQLHPALHMAVRDLLKQGKALLPREPDPGGDAHRPDLRGAGRGKAHRRSSGCAG